MPSPRRNPTSRRSTSTPSGTQASKRPVRSSEATMNWKKTFAVIRREYVERVRTKAFWLGTALIPLLFLSYMALSHATSRKAGVRRKLAVVDTTGRLYAPLARDLQAAEAEER